MKTFEEIKALCTDKRLLSVLIQNLILIKVVNENYTHIQDLETLIRLLEGGLSSYYKEYYPKEEEIVLFCAKVAENTRANHYRREDKFDDVYTILAQLDIKI